MAEPRADWPRTLEAFRVWHERQPEAWEFIYGVPKLMAPGSKAHTADQRQRVRGAAGGSCAAPAVARWSKARRSRSMARP